MTTGLPTKSARVSRWHPRKSTLSSPQVNTLLSIWMWHHDIESGAASGLVAILPDVAPVDPGGLAVREGAALVGGVDFLVQGAGLPDGN